MKPPRSHGVGRSSLSMKLLVLSALLTLFLVEVVAVIYSQAIGADEKIVAAFIAGVILTARLIKARLGWLDTAPKPSPRRPSNVRRRPAPARRREVVAIKAVRQLGASKNAAASSLETSSGNRSRPRREVSAAIRAGELSATRVSKKSSAEPTRSATVTADSNVRCPVVLDQSNTRQLMRKMRDRIDGEYAGKDVTYVWVMQGAGVFAANLELGVKLPRSVESVHAYAHFNADGGRDVDVRFVREEAIRGRHVIVVDDMLISGETLHLLSEKLLPMGPASIEHAVLVVKRGECRFPGISPRYAGIEVNPKAHIVGMGMDWAGKFRSLPHLAQLVRAGLVADRIDPEVRVLLPGFSIRRAGKPSDE